MRKLLLILPFLFSWFIGTGTKTIAVVAHDQAKVILRKESSFRHFLAKSKLSSLKVFSEKKKKKRATMSKVPALPLQSSPRITCTVSVYQGSVSAHWCEYDRTVRGRSPPLS